MSVVVATQFDDLNHRHHQQDDEGETASDISIPIAPILLQLHMASSPDQERHSNSAMMSVEQLQTNIKGHNHASRSDANFHASPFKQLHRELQRAKEALTALRVEKDKEIASLKEQLAMIQQSKTSPVASISVGTMNPSLGRPLKHMTLSTSPCSNLVRIVPWIHSITECGGIHTAKLGRHASIKSTSALAEIQQQQAVSQSLSPPSTILAERVAAAFLNPVLSLPYLHSVQFGADLVDLSAQLSILLEKEERCLRLQSPVHVIGDIHGNFTDLTFFADHFWRFGFSLAAGSFLFLGDYVDRGTSSLECVAYLFANKLLYPNKVFLLRGNHETRAINGLEAHYGSGSFLTQCRQRFGHDEGYIVWHQINHAFDRLPLAATIDHSVFCVHGGIPRALSLGERQLDSIFGLPAVASMDVLDKKFYDDNPQLTMVSDMLWGDPAREEHESALDPVTGFGRSVLRGGNAVSYGTRAVDEFLDYYKFSYVLRAHEATMDGIQVAKNARVITIFSTSKDHGLGDDATCGCVLVDKDRLLAMNRSVGYGKQQLTRRRSMATLQPPQQHSISPTTSLAMAMSSLSAELRSVTSSDSSSASAIQSCTPPFMASSLNSPHARQTRSTSGETGQQTRTSSRRTPMRRRNRTESDSTDDEDETGPPTISRGSNASVMTTHTHISSRTANSSDTEVSARATPHCTRRHAYALPSTTQGENNQSEQE